ncbi:MAG TPA: hypothetical protein VHZ73_03260 [Vicinamibacterales bacterium]|nr:hypothetical protein [Vicinamibacterales bacterium]
MRRAITLATLVGILVGQGFSLAFVQYRSPPANSAARNLPSGWIGLFDGTGHCRYAVPPTWSIDDRYSRNAFAMSPDGSVIVHQAWVTTAGWSDFVENALRTLQPGRTIARTDNELRVEHATGEADSQRYIALRAGAGVCVGTIDLKTSANAATLAVAAQIEKTVSVAK